MISQHFYTRERRGLYNASAGYDTVAKSKELSDSFVKEKIHPYCTYNGGGENVMTLAHFPCGKMLLSQAVHVAADFTGQRTAFFIHNYILPAEMAGGTLKNFNQLLNTKFETSYAFCDELEALPCCIYEKKTESEIPNETIAYIAHCVIKSVAESVKTYVLVPKGFSARDLLVKLYEVLPEAVKHLLGFCTYSRAAEKRKNIHLMFWDKAVYRQEKSRFARDFIIDLNGNYQAEKIEIDNAAYLTERIQELTVSKFFEETAFWYLRMPQLRDYIKKAEINWLENNINQLTHSQFAAIPAHFIKRGKHGDNPAIYVQLHILKTVSAALIANRVIPLRYFLGNYFFSPYDYHRVILNLRRIYENFNTPPHSENIEFLLLEM